MVANLSPLIVSACSLH
ncbi:rCG61323 [Rattus norvegicus]|uniref:RCG61323 n=1 Tax=Rattus norvegicus TaxID=10116 RepID=A6HBF9_RAT|nr:rCG61323 [Rattus norvegicus]